MGREIELKLVLPQTAFAALRRHPVVAGSARLASATLDNVYYDTKDLALKKRSIGLRTRRHGKKWVQTVKCAAPSAGGLSQRPEWEQPYTGAFDFSAIDDPRTHKHLLRHHADLAPVFSTCFKRETRRYAPDGQVSILLMLDRGEIICGEQREPLCELELELERGAPLDLLKLALQLAAGLPLLPSNVSKAERGYRLHEGYVPATSPPRSALLSRHDAPTEAFKVLALDCVALWQSCVEAAAFGCPPGIIHQLRVSHRRLRALLKVFGPVLPAGFAQTWSGQLGRNADQFGPARDLDVLCDDILARVIGSSADEIAALARLQAVASEAREAARHAARQALDPIAQGRLILAFMVALHSLPAQAPDQPENLRAVARQRVAGLRKSALRHLGRARDLAPQHLHALRIAIKKLRYSLEFFNPLQRKRATRDATNSLEELQCLLGYVCDVDAARRELNALAGDDMELRAAAAYACGWHARQYRRACRKALRCADALLRNDSRPM
ncbi:MAG: CHAD domain-containing protein [Rhodocyclales bacterium]|nr:CHAD domain-containing protein [Rhodocyclales bacterium]